VGRRPPAADASGGHGLWLVHQVCDKVELHSNAGGTTIRLHMSLAPAGRPRGGEAREEGQLPRRAERRSSPPR
jgi:hypothetical protein